MEIIKQIVNLLNEIKACYREIQALGRWKRNAEEEDLARINNILQKRTELLLQIDRLNARVLPLRKQLEGLKISDLMQDIMQDNYRELDVMVGNIREEDGRLMNQLNRRMERIKKELGALNQKSYATKCYLSAAAMAY